MKYIITLLGLFTMSISSAWADETAVAKIGDTEYTDASEFKDELNNLSGDVTVTLLDDIDLFGLDTNWEINSGNNIIFDLNGHKILGHFWLECSSMIINDSSEDKTGSIETSSDNRVIRNYNYLTINGGTLIGGRPFDNEGTITVNGGKFEKSGDGTMNIFNFGQITAGEGWGFLFDDGEYKTQIEDEDIATSYTIIKVPIASIGYTYYSDMATFTTDVQNLNRKADIRIFKDIDLEIEGRYLGITNGSDITLDLNGHKLKGWFDIYSSLTITDSSEGGNGSVEAGDGYYIFVVNSGSLTINAGSFVGGGVIYNVGGSVVLGGGQYKSTSSSRLAIRLDDGTVSLKYGCTYQADGKDDLKEITESVDYDGSVVVLPSAVAELMGSTIYEEEDLGDEYIIYVNDEGYIVTVYGYDDCTNLSTNFRVTIDGDNYVFTDTRYGYIFIFYVEGGKVTKISDVGSEAVFYPKESVATGIKDVEGAKANKATKALENGRMIIIRNGEKYDLCGSKL